MYLLATRTIHRAFLGSGWGLRRALEAHEGVRGCLREAYMARKCQKYRARERRIGRGGVMDSLTAYEEELRMIEALKASGHPDHCAKRQVWGDGECECDLYKRGDDPYEWMGSDTQQA